MEKKNIVVLYGGYSSEHEVSKASAATIIENMSEEKYNIIPVYITTEGKWLLYDGHIENIKNINYEKFGTPVVLSTDRGDKCLLRIVGNKIKNIPIDVIFPVLHGVNGEDGTVQGLFEIAGVPYVGCGVLASAISMDKYYTKIVVSDLGIKQAEYLSFKQEDLDDINEVMKKIRYKIGYPCFIKPANSGSAVGVSKAKNKKDLEAAIELAVSYDKKIIVEKAIIGRELECAVLGSGGNDTEASAIGEVLPASEFYDYDAKYNNSESKTVVPADIPDEISDQIKNAAIKIFKGVGGKGLSRVDFFLEEETNNIIFNEINTLPGFTSISMYPMLWNHAGLTTPQLIDKLIELAIV